MPKFSLGSVEIKYANCIGFLVLIVDRRVKKNNVSISQDIRAVWTSVDKLAKIADHISEVYEPSIFF